MATDSEVGVLPQRGRLMLLSASLFLGGMLVVMFLRNALVQPSDWMAWAALVCVLAAVGGDFYVMSERLRRIDRALSVQTAHAVVVSDQAV